MPRSPRILRGLLWKHASIFSDGVKIGSDEAPGHGEFGYSMAFRPGFLAPIGPGDPCPSLSLSDVSLANHECSTIAL